MSKMKIQERPTRNLSFIQVQAILVLYKHGYGAPEVAKFFNVSRMAVYHHYRHFKAHGVFPYVKPIAETLAEEGYE